MREICIVDISTTAPTSSIYVELMGALSTSFTQLGVKVHFEIDRIRHDMPNIIFGRYRQFVDETRVVQALPPNCIIFNLAPLSGVEKAPWLGPYIHSLKDHPVIDYSYYNLGFIPAGEEAQHFLFKFGYLPLSAFKFPMKSRQFVFYGKVTEHRLPILKYLREELKIPLRVLTNCWGHERDMRIATAQATINIGKFDASLLEVYRIWHSLCLGTPVISEKGGDARLVDDWREYVQFVDAPESWRHVKIDRTSPTRYAKDTSFVQETERLLRWIDQCNLSTKKRANE
ncbi:hypothetical protein [Undibacterium fentianense]|uniref:Uncharacterized protein n=1 Tax=Undibacterium fentianense TaxID=2828728 RepID=A0A941E298_9BURK|nr:hypothetical protein [Undibacterium fentianense]MBR7801040.1 hypothetical protein [Undibacterium fentianense]